MCLLADFNILAEQFVSARDVFEQNAAKSSPERFGPVQSLRVFGARSRKSLPPPHTGGGKTAPRQDCRWD